jgi:2-amino-4-hydroxy-6-hydroxymethyldihydropteridine diphosphokinase
MNLASGTSMRGGRPVTRRVRSYIGLGANVGDAERTLAAAVNALAALPGAALRGVSRLYATRPVGDEHQPEFRNAVVALDVPAGADPETGAQGLLLALKGLERAFGRRPRGRWSPRELDLDVLVFGRAQIAASRPSGTEPADPAKARLALVVPHPEASRRLFVLAPLADLAPRLRPPGWASTVESMRRRQADREGPDAVRVVGRWDRARRAWVPDEGPRADSPAARGRSGRPG